MIVTNPDGVEVAAPDSGNVFSNLIPSRKGSVKVVIQPSQPKTLSHLVHREPVAIAFEKLVYTVSEGRKKSKYPKRESVMPTSSYFRIGKLCRGSPLFLFSIN